MERNPDETRTYDLPPQGLAAASPKPLPVMRQSSMADVAESREGIECRILVRRGDMDAAPADTLVMLNMQEQTVDRIRSSASATPQLADIPSCQNRSFSNLYHGTERVQTSSYLDSLPRVDQSDTCPSFAPA
jgi:hypothetical protein